MTGTKRERKTFDASKAAKIFAKAYCDAEADASASVWTRGERPETIVILREMVLAYFKEHNDGVEDQEDQENYILQVLKDLEAMCALRVCVDASECSIALCDLLGDLFSDKVTRAILVQDVGRGLSPQGWLNLLRAALKHIAEK